MPHLTIADIIPELTHTLAGSMREPAVAYYGPIVRGVMGAMAAKDSSDAEIERCFGGCIGAEALMAVALVMREDGIDLTTPLTARVATGTVDFGFPRRK
jgi:hypothetical protein